MSYDPNQNIPCEREWTMQEMEDFFAGQDAITGVFNGTPTNITPFRPKPSIHRCGNELAFSTTEGLECSFYWVPEWKGIHVTAITPPAQGWPVAMHCPLCKETTFILSRWAIKPKDGGYWKISDACANDLVSESHNMKMAMRMRMYPE